MKPRETEGSCSTGPHRAFRSCAPKAVGVGLLVGFLTGLLGVGGGFLITPALTIFLGLRMKQAVGTSLAIIVINSAAGFSAHAAGYTIDWATTLAFAVPAIVGSVRRRTVRPPPEGQAHPYLVRGTHLRRRGVGHRRHGHRLTHTTNRRTPWD